MHQIDRHAEVLAAEQSGRFTRSQVYEAGATVDLVSARLRSGRWKRETSKVLSLPGAPRGTEADMWTSTLHAGPAAVLSCESAGSLHGLPALRPGRVRLWVPHGSHIRHELFVARQTRDLPPQHVTGIDGLPVTSLPRTIADLAPDASRTRIETWLDHVTAERLCTPTQIAGVLDDLAGPGRRGLRPLVLALGDRLPGSAVEQGRLERQLTHVLRVGGIGDGIAQFPHPAGAATGAGLADRGFPQATLLVEADGRRWHERKLAAGRDARRDRAAVLVGWATLRYTYEELMRAPRACAQELREAFVRRGGQRRSV